MTAMNRKQPLHKDFSPRHPKLHSQLFLAVDINLAVGTRTLSAQAFMAYEIPPEAVSEAMVNTIAHCDYTRRSGRLISRETT